MKWVWAALCSLLMIAGVYLVGSGAWVGIRDITSSGVRIGSVPGGAGFTQTDRGAEVGVVLALVVPGILLACVGVALWVKGRSRFALHG